MDDENLFHCQLGRTIQTWLWIESQLYELYSVLMKGANTHLISVTFNHIQSVDAKLSLLKSCLALILDKEQPEWKLWKNLFSKAEKLNKKRNKIVHEPVILSFSKGRKTIAISPSHFNALALVKGQTTNKNVVISANYKPTQAKILIDHKIDLAGLHSLEREFRNFSFELRKFQTQVEPIVQKALSAAKQTAKAQAKKVEEPPLP